MTGAERFTAPASALKAASGTSFRLAPLSPREGQTLGPQIAAMFPWSAYGYPASALSRFLAAAEPGASRLGFVVDGDVVGCAVIRPIWLRGPYLNFLALLPAAQRRGIGGAFLDWMESEARAAEDRNMWVAASEINAGAIRLYERYGFHKTALLDALVYDDRNEVLFRKRLSYVPRE